VVRYSAADGRESCVKSTKKTPSLRRCFDVEILDLSSVGAAAAAARRILAHAVAPDGCSPAGVPPEAAIGLARLGVAANAVDAASPVPACECAFGECAAAVAAGAGEFERNRACHSFTSVFFLYLQYNRYNARCQVLMTKARTAEDDVDRGVVKGKLRWTQKNGTKKSLDLI